MHVRAVESTHLPVGAGVELLRTGSKQINDGVISETGRPSDPQSS